MMPEIMLAWSGSLAVSTVAKGTVATALGLIGARLARRSRAAVRHALLAASFGVLLVLPAASVVAPPVRIAVPVAAQALTVLTPFAGAIDASSAIRPAAAGTEVAPASRPWRLSPSAVLLTAWISGAALFLLPMAMGLWQVRSLRRSGQAWPHGQSVAEGLASDAGIRRRVEVLLHEALAGPMTCGVLSPAIVLPLDARNWEEQDLNRAMVHELEHVQRRDWVNLCLARAICAAYWFHPLVWIAWRKLTLEAERACDDAVLGCSEATAYADQLVGVAQRLSLIAKKQGTKFPLLAMANRADLAKRVGAVLDRGQRRGRAGVFPVALACTAAAVLVLTMSPLRMVAAPQAANTGVGTATMPRFSTTTTLVLESVSVFDQSGRTVDGLRAGDFALTEDGRVQRISFFEFQRLPDTTPGVQGSVSSYYILGYYTTNPKMDGEFRNIRVSLPGDTTSTLRSGTGYFAGVGRGRVENSAAPRESIPVPIYSPEPEYAEDARKAKFQGTVILTVQVEASGQVTNINVTRRLGLGLDEKAIEAVRQWRFKPGTMGGQPVPVLAEVEVNFRLL